MNTSAVQSTPSQPRIPKSKVKVEPIVLTVDEPTALQNYVAGKFVPYVENPLPTSGICTAFFNAYLRGNTSGAKMGWTGPMVASWLCELGFVQIKCDGVVYPEKTPGDEMPSALVLKENGAWYKAVKPLPTRKEFWTMIDGYRAKARETNLTSNAFDS